MIRMVHALVELIVASVAVSSVHAEDIVRLGHNRTWSNTALILGLAHGDFSTFGIKVVEHEFTSPADIITGIAGAATSTQNAPAGNFFAAVSRGVKAKAVSVAPGAQQSADRLYRESRFR